MHREDEQAPGAPAWIVTFGDMMSLLLTFFIMLVSMSEMKEDEKFQAMIDSMRQEFGREASLFLMPGDFSLRNSNMMHTASAGRARRRDTLSGSTKARAVVGDHSHVQSARMGKHTSQVGVVLFDEEGVTLTAQAREQLQQAAAQIAGKPHRIEIRGHTSRRPLGVESTMRDKWDLAYERCRVVMQFLAGQGVDPQRIYFRVAADNEPTYEGTDRQQQRQNSRVQVLLWDERVGE
jgi:chemotaxis protein MotB